MLKVFTNDELAAAENNEQRIYVFAALTTTATANGCILSIGNTVTPTGQVSAKRSHARSPLNAAALASAQKGLCVAKAQGDNGQGITVISAPVSARCAVRPRNDTDRGEIECAARAQQGFYQIPVVASGDNILIYIRRHLSANNQVLVDLTVQLSGSTTRAHFDDAFL